MILHAHETDQTVFARRVTAWQRYVALFDSPAHGRGEFPNLPQSDRLLGAFLAVGLPIVVLGLTAALLTHHVWIVVLAPLCLTLIVCARLSRAGHRHLANWLLPIMLTVASLGTEYSQIPGGPTPLLLGIAAVFLSGFLIDRRIPFVFAAVNAILESLHLHMMMAAHSLPQIPAAGLPQDEGPTPPWFFLIPLAVHPVIALVSSLTAGSLEIARSRADELVRINVSLADANARLEALATADPLTGLLNHRGLVAALDVEMDRAHRYSRPCVLLFADIDHFKALNDGYGHATGDAILQEFAQVVKTTLRSVDLLGRWGGEEFVILLPEMDTASAAMAAERVRSTVAEHVFPSAGGLRLTCSVGTAAYPVDATERGPLLDAADRAMYAAKRLGRNQVRHAGEPAVVALLTDRHANGSREEATLVGTVDALASLVAARDGYTGEHSQDVADLAVRLCVALGLSAAEARMIGLAGRLHDIGKVGVPDAILNKTEPLTEDEWAIVRRHPAVGADVVGHAPTLRALAALIRGHHERWDGRGYPDGLSGEAIPLGARVLAVADSYRAMTSDRPYRTARETAWALEQIRELSGAQFDPQVVDALMRMLRNAPETARGTDRLSTFPMAAFNAKAA